MDADYRRIYRVWINSRTDGVISGNFYVIDENEEGAITQAAKQYKLETNNAVRDISIEVVVDWDTVLRN